MSRRAWTDEELVASIIAYKELLSSESSGGTMVKADVYRKLAEQFSTRSPKAFEFRMQNISAVYESLGRARVKGLAPARNVGSSMSTKIERLIGEVEQTEFADVCAFEERVVALLTSPLAIPSGTIEPVSSPATVLRFERDAKVVAYVLQQANGICESCDHAAPFSKPNGLPYLEVHHLRRLADGGSDKVSNAVAVCPNCHARLHYSSDRDELRSQIEAKLERITRE